MFHGPVIRSRANAELKRIAAARRGKPNELLVLEGDRLIDDALSSGLALEAVFVAESRSERAAALAALGVTVRSVTDELLASASGLAASPGILALAHAPRTPDASSLAPEPRALVLVVAGVADPGNLGAIARSAEAAGTRALCAVEGGASPWNEKALRGSMGSLLRLPVHRFDSPAAALAALPRHRHVRAATRGGVSWRSFDWSGPLALWISSEVGDELLSAEPAFERVTIPMASGPESLNVTVAASLLLFAAGRVEER